MTFQCLCSSEAAWRHVFWVGPPRREGDPATVTAILCDESAFICCQMLGKKERLHYKRLCKYIHAYWKSLIIYWKLWGILRPSRTDASAAFPRGKAAVKPNAWMNRRNINNCFFVYVWCHVGNLYFNTSQNKAI